MMRDHRTTWQNKDMDDDHGNDITKPEDEEGKEDFKRAFMRSTHLLDL
jgi:hypothetical protein